MVEGSGVQGFRVYGLGLRVHFGLRQRFKGSHERLHDPL